MNQPISSEPASPSRWKPAHAFAGLCLLIIGVLLGRAVFPMVIEKPFIVEKRIEVPVERVLEKKIEVPVEKIVYVSERTKGVNGAEAFLISPEKLAMWKQIKVGMTRREVTDILGAPSRADGDISFDTKTGAQLIMWEWRTGNVRGGVWFVFGGDGRVHSVVIPER